jgi:hypothetical protein
MNLWFGLGDGITTQDSGLLGCYACSRLLGLHVHEDEGTAVLWNTPDSHTAEHPRRPQPSTSTLWTGGHEGPVEAYTYSSTLSLTSAPHGVGWLAPRPGHFYPRESDPVPIAQEAGWAPGPVWTGAENLAPTGIRPTDRPARSESICRLRYPSLALNKSLKHGSPTRGPPPHL